MSIFIRPVLPDTDFTDGDTELWYPVQGTQRGPETVSTVPVDLLQVSNRRTVGVRRRRSTFKSLNVEFDLFRITGTSIKKKILRVTIKSY